MNDQQASILDGPAISGCYLFPQPRRVIEPFEVSVGDVQLRCYRRVVNPDSLTVVQE